MISINWQFLKYCGCGWMVDACGVVWSVWCGHHVNNHPVAVFVPCLPSSFLWWIINLICLSKNTTILPKYTQKMNHQLWSTSHDIISYLPKNNRYRKILGMWLMITACHFVETDDQISSRFSCYFLVGFNFSSTQLSLFDRSTNTRCNPGEFDSYNSI